MSSAPATKYEMPKVEQGDMVIWKHHPSDQRGSPAMVTTVGPKTLSLNIIIEGVSVMKVVTGCRHISDPGLNEHHARDSGVWDFTPETKKLVKLEGRVAALEKQMHELLTPVSPNKPTPPATK